MPAITANIRETVDSMPPGAVLAEEFNANLDGDAGSTQKRKRYVKRQFISAIGGIRG